MCALKDLVAHYSDENNLSDIHIRAGCPPSLRINGCLVRQGKTPVSKPMLMAFAREFLSEDLIRRWQHDKSLDTGLRVAGQTYRAHFYFAAGHAALALRKINHRPPTLQELAMPEAVAGLLDGNGLVLVTGPTGSGKSTTLAAMLGHIIDRAPAHALTIEDPVEYRFETSEHALLSQREIGVDANSFESALRASLREDPDFILLGEVREAASAALVLTAAETGHLVLTTLHASHCAHALSRLIAMFPVGQHEQVRMRLADCVRMIINQRLFVRRDGSGRVAAYEVLIFNNAARNLLRDNKLFQLSSLTETARHEGMISMREAVARLCRSRLIVPAVATAEIRR